MEKELGIRYTAQRLEDDFWVEGWLLRSSRYATKPGVYKLAVEGDCTKYLGLEFVDIKPETLKELNRN